MQISFSHSKWKSGSSKSTEIALTADIMYQQLLEMIWLRIINEPPKKHIQNQTEDNTEYVLWCRECCGNEKCQFLPTLLEILKMKRLFEMSQELSWLKIRIICCMLACVVDYVQVHSITSMMERFHKELRKEHIFDFKKKLLLENSEFNGFLTKLSYFEVIFFRYEILKQNEQKKCWNPIFKCFSTPMNYRYLLPWR